MWIHYMDIITVFWNLIKGHDQGLKLCRIIFIQVNTNNTQQLGYKIIISDSYPVLILK